MKLTKKNIKIAFITADDPLDKKSWSGAYYYLGKALQEYCGDVDFLGPVNIRWDLCEKRLNKIHDLNDEKKYNPIHSIALSIKYAEIFEKKLAEKHYDVIFAPAAATEVAFINTDVPIIYLSDATFALLNDYYPFFSNLIKMSVEEGNIVERIALNKASLLIYPWKWAANSAINDYGVDPSRVHVVPWGSNLDYIPSKKLVLEKRKSDTCRLLFVGVDWERKGGNIAFETLQHLENLGLKSQLTICGCTPPKNLTNKNMIVIPFLDKNNPSDSEKLYNLYLNSDFLLVPSRSECGGCIFSEVNAFGLPSITTDTGAITETVQNNINGFVLPFDLKGTDYANLIYNIYSNDELYYSLVRRSREYFDQNISWKNWGNKVSLLLKNLINY